MGLQHLLLPAWFRAWLRTVIVVTRDYRHTRTFTRGSLSPRGEPWPWFSYAAIFYLERFDFSACRVLEFGSGGSTAFWCRKAREVLSIETDAAWRDTVLRTLPANGRVLFFGPDDFAGCRAQAAAGAPFDVVVIDGAWRHLCARHVMEWLAPHGLVILDNPDWYPRTHAEMARHDLLEVSFTGLTPISARSSTTSIYFPRTFRIPFRDSFRFSDLPGSVVDNHETGSPDSTIP